MSRINCSYIECKFNGDDYICQKESVSLSFHSIATVNQGRKEFLQCKQFEERDDEEWKNLKDIANEMVKMTFK